MTGAQRLPNPYLVGVTGPEARTPQRLCWWLHSELGRELFALRLRLIDVDIESYYALQAIHKIAMNFVPPEEQAPAKSSEQRQQLKWLSTAEAAGLLGVRTPRAVTQAIARGTLPAVRVGRIWRISRDDLLTYKATRNDKCRS